MTAIARRRAGYTHDVEIGDGHSVVFDEPSEMGGDDAGASPTQMLAASLAACTAITMEMYADRKEWPLEDVEVSVDMQTPEGDTPRKFTVNIGLPKELSDDQRERLLKVAAKCPVHRALSDEGHVEIADRVELI